MDGALTEFGFPMGPFAMSDLAGLDVGWRIAQGARRAQRDRRHALPSRAASGRRPARASISTKAARARPDPEVEKLIVDASVRLGVKRRNVSKDEIVERLIYPMVNEGARILEEGIATRPGDIDVVWLYGYGFPAWRGGPMHWADTVGLKKIRDRLREMAKETGDKRHEPAALLNKLADEGGTFSRRYGAAEGRVTNFISGSDVYDRGRHRIHRPHADRQGVPRRLQHDAWRHARRPCGEARGRARRDRSGRGRGRGARLRDAGEGHRQQHRAAFGDPRRHAGDGAAA